MTKNVREEVITLLQNDFIKEQLFMIGNAIAKVLQNVIITSTEELPVVYGETPIEIKEFIARKKIKGCSQGTVYQYQKVLEGFCAYIKKDVKEVKDIDVLMYLDFAKTKKQLSDRTLDTRRLILSSFYTFLHDTGKISINSLKSIDRIKFVEKKRQALTDIELEKIRNACITPREKALFEVLYSTGCRVSEVTGLKWSDIDWQNRSVKVLGKGKKERTVFFNAKSLIALQNYKNSRKDEEDIIFIGERNCSSCIKKCTMEKIIRDLGKRAKINRPVFPHLIRHTFATNMFIHGANIYEVSQILGHTKIETTKIYVKTNDDMLRNSHRKCLV